MPYEWGDFFDRFSVSDAQRIKLERYYELLVDWNSRINLTALTSFVDVREYHFADSIAVASMIDLHACSGLVDVGTGAGFPGIPLKILYPDLPIVLIEVIAKRRSFLEAVVSELNLSNIEICPLDWRTFVHATAYTHDIFCARASLRPDELCCMFSGKSRYKRAQLIYWASQNWLPGATEKKYLRKMFAYTVGDRSRKYVFFKK